MQMLAFWQMDQTQRALLAQIAEYREQIQMMSEALLKYKTYFENSKNQHAELLQAKALILELYAKLTSASYACDLLADLEAKIAAQRAEVENMRKERDILSRQCDERSTLISEAAKTLQRNFYELNEKDQRVSILQSENMYLRTQMATLQTQLYAALQTQTLYQAVQFSKKQTQLYDMGNAAMSYSESHVPEYIDQFLRHSDAQNFYEDRELTELEYALQRSQAAPLSVTQHIEAPFKNDKIDGSTPGLLYHGWCYNSEYQDLNYYASNYQFYEQHFSGNYVPDLAQVVCQSPPQQQAAEETTSQRAYMLANNTEVLANAMPRIIAPPDAWQASAAAQVNDYRSGYLREHKHYEQSCEVPAYYMEAKTVYRQICGYHAAGKTRAVSTQELLDSHIRVCDSVSALDPICDNEHLLSYTAILIHKLEAAYSKSTTAAYNYQDSTAVTNKLACKASTANVPPQQPRCLLAESQRKEPRYKNLPYLSYTALATSNLNSSTIKVYSVRAAKRDAANLENSIDNEERSVEVQQLVEENQILYEELFIARTYVQNLSGVLPQARSANYSVFNYNATKNY